MLVSFTVGNFLSFKDNFTLSLVPDALKELPGNLNIPYLFDSRERLLKSVAIYGHNSYGKTNFIKAFQFFQQCVFNSFSTGQTKNTIDIQPFQLSTSTLNKPSYFEITFLIKETRYRYRAQVTSNFIVEEGLYYSEAKIRENYLFERTGQAIKVSKSWNKDNSGKIEQVISFARPHILFLSVLFSQETLSRITEISNWLRSSVIIPDNYMGELSKARNIYADLNYRNLIQKFIENADLGFKTIFDKVEDLHKENVQFEKGLINMWFDKEIKNVSLYTAHTVYNDTYHIVANKDFEFLQNESAGSIKYFIIVCLLSYAIKNSQLIWIDELDARFDSNLFNQLITSYHNPKINPLGSQLIFTAHNTVLMDKKLRRDQMAVVEKNEYGESSLRRLHSSKKPLRINKSIENDYREGKLGGTSKMLKNNLPLFGSED